MIGQIHIGDCRDLLPQFKAAGVKVQMVVTSPPYWNLRDYGTGEWTGGDPKCQHRSSELRRGAGLAKSRVSVRGGGKKVATVGWKQHRGECPKCGAQRVDQQIGLELVHDCLGWATRRRCGQCYICNIVQVFRLVRDVLADDGTVWLNMGDCYASNGGVGAGGNYGRENRSWQQQSPRQGRAKPGDRIKPKDMYMMPARVALALQADGWYLRRDIIWFKKNPMPESAPDRPATTHEYIWLLSKKRRYYYDAKAIAEPASEDTHARYQRGRSAHHKHANGQHYLDGHGQTIARGFEHMRKPVGGWAAGEGSHAALDFQSEDGGARGARAHNRKALPEGQAKLGRFRDEQRAAAGKSRDTRKFAEHGSGTKQNPSFDEAMRDMPEMRNSRSVWSIATQPYKGAHFATFPEAVPARCIAAGSRPGDVVLDPFMGSGATAAAAERLGRKFIGCDLQPKYAPLQKERSAQRGLELHEARP